MNISMFTSGDLEAASHLHAACFPDPWQAEGFAALIATGAFGFKAADAEKMGGLIMGRCAGDECEVLTFAVDPRLRRRGIGAGLLACLLGSLDSRRTGTVFLEVADGNDAAIALYRKAGFDNVGRRPHYYSAGDEVRDAIVMRKILEADLSTTHDDNRRK